MAQQRAGTKRTDAHTPSNLVTEDYEYLFSEVNHISDSIEALASLAGASGWVLRNGNFGLEMSRRIHATDRLGRSTHQCHHCGAALNYFAVLEHKPTGDLIVVGETCLENRFSRATVDFKRLRKQAALNRKQMSRQRAIDAFVANNPDLAFMAAPNYNEAVPEGLRSNSFLFDVSQKLIKYGELSERQIEACRNSVIRFHEREAQRATERALSEPVPTGKQTIEGEIVSIKTVPSYSGYGHDFKMTVKGDGGWKVWSTVPAFLLNEDVQVGNRVRFTATIEASEKDNTFGFAKRPTNAALISKEAN